MDCGFIIKQINDIMEKNANNMLRSQELTMTQAGMLIELDKRKDKTASFKELEKIFSVAQSTIVGIVKRLEQKGWVEIINDTQDMRVRYAHLTLTGQEKCKEGYKHMAEAEKNLTNALTDDEKEKFKKLLNKVRNSIQ